ncbi:MAG TPA: hypothetical protein VFO06_06820 [Gemmatimonadales bacterium]|nr:hypothetical protein [Gemmatimonadales bacterium]
MSTASKLALAFAAVALAGASVAQAQVSGSIAANATVQTPLTVTGATALEFGNVFPGVNKTVDAITGGASAGRFDVAGQGSAQVTIDFILPTNLVNGGNNLAIGSWTAARNGTNTQGAATTFSPAGTETTNLAAGGTLFVWLGGQVSPTAAQVAGLYTANVTMTVAYTGL